MKTAVRGKLKSRRGESLTEVLFALLVSSMGLLLLANMLNAAGEMVIQSEETFENYTESENVLVDYGASSSSEKVSSSEGVAKVKPYPLSSSDVSSSGIMLTDSSDSSGEIEVHYYKNETFSSMPVISYKAG